MGAILGPISSWPPALLLHGKRRLTSTKHELLHCNKPNFQQAKPSYCYAKVFHGAAIVHPPCRATTQTRSVNTVTLYSFTGLKGCSRIDMVWDTYRPDSMKATTREKRGNGTSRKVSRDAKLAVYSAGFLQDVTKKEE